MNGKYHGRSPSCCKLRHGERQMYLDCHHYLGLEFLVWAVVSMFVHAKKWGGVRCRSCRVSFHDNLCLHGPTLGTPSTGVWLGTKFLLSVKGRHMNLSQVSMSRMALQKRQVVLLSLLSSLFLSLPSLVSSAPVAKLLNPLWSLPYLCSLGICCSVSTCPRFLSNLLPWLPAER